MTMQGRGPLDRGTDIRTGNYRPRRAGASTWKGALVVVVLGAAVIGGLLYVAGPALKDFARSMARDNPATLKWPFVADVIKSDLGDSLTEPIGSDPTPVSFTVAHLAPVDTIADDLTDAGLIRDPLVFQFIAVTNGIEQDFQEGTFDLNQTMTPLQIAERLQEAPVPPPQTVIIEGSPGKGIRPGTRIEQIVAILERDHPARIDPEVFLDLARNPPQSLRDRYDWMSIIPEGNSLEGFLISGTYEVPIEANAEDLLTMFLDRWTEEVGPTYEVAVAEGKDFYDVMKMAAIVQREAILDDDLPLIAGVYTNRLDGLANGVPLLNAEPTVIYANDTMQLRRLQINNWPDYVFWGLTGQEDLSNFPVSEDLQSFQTWQSHGLPAWPITSPALPAIQAAMAPDTRGKFIYFFAKCDDSGGHWFEKEFSAHQQHIIDCANQ